MAALHFVLPGDPATRSGGFIYDARMIAALRDAGRAVAVHALPPDFPFPSEATRILTMYRTARTSECEGKLIT